MDDRADRRTIRVLSIEDNPGDARLIEEKLAAGAQLGWDLPAFSVESVDRLDQGLARLEDATNGRAPAIDVILTDLDLPDSWAGETFDILRTRFPQLPIVVLTGRQDVALARTSVQAGAQDYLYKDEATGSLLAHALIYAIERQENAQALQKAHAELEQRVEARTRDLRQANTRLRRANQALAAEIAAREEAEAQLRFQAQLLDSVRESVMATDLEGHIIYWGRGAEALYGWSAEEMMGESVTVLVDPREAEAERARMRQVKETGRWRGEYRQKRKDGSSFWSDTSISLVRDERGEPCGLIGIDRDVTARKRAQSRQEATLRALKANEERLRMTIELSPIGVGIVDHRGGLIDCNAAMMKIVGYNRETLLQMNFADITHPEDLERERRLIAGLWDGSLSEYRIEKRYIHKNGHHVWVDVAASLFKDEMGTSTFGFAFVQDFTARKRAERALRESERRFQRIVEASADVIIQFDTEGRVTYCSPSVERILGLAPHTVIGSHLTCCVLDQEDVRVMQRFERVIATECIETLDVEMANHAGIALPFEITLAPIVVDGRVTGVQAAVRDVTQGK